MASPKPSAVPPATSPPLFNSSVSSPSNSSAPLPAPPPSNSSAAPPPTSPPPSNAPAASPPPSNASAATPLPSPPPSNSSAATPLPSPPPSNSSAATPLPSPPPSNSSAATPPAQSPPQSPPPSAPPPSKNSSTPSPPPTASPPPPPKRVPSSHPPPPRAHHSSIPPPTAASQNATPTANLFSSLDLTTGNVAVIATIVGLLALALVVLAVCLARGRKKKKTKNQENIGKDISNTDHNNHVTPSPFASHNSASSTFLRPQYSNASTASDIGRSSSRSWFTYEELSEATDGFSTDNLIGQGGFGCVYKGILNTDGRRVAVKRLKAGSGQGEREFRAEVEIISRIHHKHLVSLVGYCISENQRLLVYDFVSNNNLDYHVHDESKPVMDWASRVKVASGAARGLAYLHEDCQPRIIHRDIKSTNILLDNNFEAKVADFGLAKIALDLDLQTHVSTRVMGTFGYMAPEYAASGKLTEKSDVFSFGVVLLELITGRMPVDPSQPLGDESLVECARPLLAEALKTQDFDGLVDPRLESNFVEVEMFRMIEAAAACVRHSASKRPKMSQVARALDSMDELADLNNGIRPGQSGNFDSREHSARIRMFDRMAFGSKSDSVDFSSSQRSWRS